MNVKKTIVGKFSLLHCIADIYRKVASTNTSCCWLIYIAGFFLLYMLALFHFGKRTVIPPNFILEQQTVSHMKAEVFFFNLIPY
jgi:hypothetical protein